MEEWFKTFFGENYLKIHESFFSKDTAKKEVDFILKKTSYHSDLPILDLCCGQGRHCIEFAKRGFSVVGKDLSEYLLNEAKSRSLGLNITYQQEDMGNLSDQNKYGLVPMFLSLT